MPPSADVTPGMWGFVAFAVLAIVLYLLMRNMTSRMRRMNYRQRDAHRGESDPQATEEDVRRARGAGGPPDTTGSGRTDDRPT